MNLWFPAVYLVCKRPCTVVFLGCKQLKVAFSCDRDTSHWKLIFRPHTCITWAWPMMYGLSKT